MIMCDCIMLTNKALKEHNTRLNVPFILSGAQPRVLVSTMKHNAKSRVKPILLHATYCPFCGKKYDDADEGCLT